MKMVYESTHLLELFTAITKRCLSRDPNYKEEELMEDSVTPEFIYALTKTRSGIENDPDACTIPGVRENTFVTTDSHISSFSFFS